MIGQNKHLKKYCSEPIENIENYDKAIADTEHQWHCHHRGEILPCGRNSRDTLEKFGLYWQRPASELIFLRHDEHIRLHKIGNKNTLGKKTFLGHHHSEVTRIKLSDMNKGSKNHFFGKKHTKETRKKISESQTGKKNHNFGKPRSEETKRKIREAALNRWRKSQ